MVQTAATATMKKKATPRQKAVQAAAVHIIIPHSQAAAQAATATVKTEWTVRAMAQAAEAEQ